MKDWNEQSACASQTDRRGKRRREGAKNGVGRRERMKRGRGMKDRDERRLAKHVTWRKRNWSDSSDSSLVKADASRWAWKVDEWSRHTSRKVDEWSRHTIGLKCQLLTAEIQLGLVDSSRRCDNDEFLILTSSLRAPSGSGAPSEHLVCVSWPIGCRCELPNLKCVMVKCMIRVL